MEKYIDPITARNQLLNDTERAVGYEVVTPTTPFTALLYSIATTQNSFRDSLFRHESRIFPSISSTHKDIYHMVTNDNDINLFSSPAIGEVTLSLDADNILSNAVYNKDTSTFYFSISENTSIDVDGVTLTIPNKIECSLYVINNILMESAEFSSINPIFFKNIGKLKTYITYNEDSKPVMNIVTPVLQVKHERYEANVLLSNNFETTLPITDDYYYARVDSINADGSLKRLKTVYVDDRYDPDIASVYIDINSDNIRLKIPKVYISNGYISNKILITVYTTKGKVLLHLSEYTKNDFSLSLAKSTDKNVIASKNMTIHVSSDTILKGGSNKSDFRTIKNKIIDSTSGIIETPTTEKQLKEVAKLSSFTIYKDTDNILDRVYKVTTDKGLIAKSSDGVNYPNILTITPSIVIDDTSDLQDTVIANKKYLVIKPNTLFNVDLVSKAKYDLLKALNPLEMISELNDNQYTYNPYHIIADNNTKDVSSRVYDTTNPTLGNIRIKTSNQLSLEKCNITGYKVFKTDTGYGMLFRLGGNNQYIKVKDNVRVQLKIPTVDNTGVYFTSSLDFDATKRIFPDAVEAMHYIHITTSDYINEFDNYEILNGYAPFGRNVNTDVVVDIIIYSLDTSTAQTNNVLNYIPSSKIIPSNAQVIGLTEETISFIPMIRLKHLSSQLDSSYVGRKFEVYAEDIPARYSEDIYEVTPIGCGYNLTDTDGNGKPDVIDRTKIHSSGDVILDHNGKPMIKYKKGEIIYHDGVPVEVGSLGIKRIMEIVTLDYKYKYLNTPLYEYNIGKTLKEFTTSIIKDIPKLNEKLLNNTTLKLITRRNLNKCVTTNDEELESTVSPEVIVYTSKDIKVTDSIDNLTNIVGNILVRYISKLYINMEDIEKAIVKEMNNIYGVQIKNITPTNNRVFYLKQDSNRLTVKKVIDDNFNIKYGLKLKIVSI